MTTIRNINDSFGDNVQFEAADITEAVCDMAQAIIACGHALSDGKTVDEMADSLVEGVDYQIID